MSGNPWICDCTTIAFIQFQDDNQWFKYQYDERTGIVDLGTCQYPRALRNDINSSEAVFGKIFPSELFVGKIFVEKPRQQTTDNNFIIATDVTEVRQTRTLSELFRRFFL